QAIEITLRTSLWAQLAFSLAASEDSSAGRRQREAKRFARNARYIRANQPPQACRNIAGQRNRLRFDVCPPILFFETPIRIHSPEKPAVVPFGQKPLIGLACVFHFLNSSRMRLAPRAARIDTLIVNSVFGLGDSGYHLLLVETQQDLEIVAVP